MSSVVCPSLRYVPLCYTGVKGVAEFYKFVSLQVFSGKIHEMMDNLSGVMLINERSIRIHQESSANVIEPSGKKEGK